MTLYVADPYNPGKGGGQPRITLPGSGLAVPPGIESVLEYNGLLMNIQVNGDRYRITSIDGLEDADIRDTRDVNTDDHGETPYNSFYGGRTIVISGTIDTYSILKLRDMQSAMKKAFVDTSREFPLHFRTGSFFKDCVIYCKKAVPMAGVEQQQNRMVTRDFQITLRASDPRFFSYYSKFFDKTITGSGIVDFIIANNAGNFFAEPVLRFYGPMASASLFNNQTEETLKVLACPANDYLEFDIQKKTLTNKAGANKWSKLDDSSDFFHLASGDNHIDYVSGNCPRITMAWRDSSI